MKALSTTHRRADQKSAWQNKSGKTAGDLLLKYRGKIAGQAKAKQRAATRAPRE